MKSLRLNDEFISVLKQFKQLKRLDLHSYYKGRYESPVDYHPLEDFEELNGLTHLRIEIMVFAVQFIPKEEILTNIDINLPKLQYLKINCPFIASEWSAKVLSKLSYLETIELKIRNQEFGLEIERQLRSRIANISKVLKITYNSNKIFISNLFDFQYIRITNR